MIRVYRTLRLQVQGIDRVFWAITGSAKLTLLVLAVFCIYSAIRLDGILSVALATLGVTTVVFLAIVVNAWAEFHSRSCRVLKALRTKLGTLIIVTSPRQMMGPKLYRATLRSLPPLKIPILGLFFVDKPVVLLDMKVLSDGIIFLLVNF